MELDSTLKMTIITLKMLGIDGFSPVVSEGYQYSNDGLLFVTYDHYETFYEIK